LQSFDLLCRSVDFYKGAQLIVFPANGSETVSDMMTADEYERLSPEEKEHFAMWKDV